MMFSSIHKNLILIINYYEIQNNQHSILISLSGGQDSLCLMKILLNINNSKLWNINLIHFNHRWRENSDQNSYLLKYIALMFDLKIYTYINYKKFLSENHARQWRYKVLFFVSEIIKSNILCTAHTLTDNLESSLSNLIRGCTLEGLTGFSSIRKMSLNKYIFRPLISFNRDQSSWYCRYFLLPVWSDHTNYNYNLQRNRIRNELMPYLRNFFNSKIEDQLSFSLNKIKLDAIYLNYITEYFYSSIHHKNFIAINHKILGSLYSSIQSRLIKLFIQSHFEIIINRSQIEKILQYLIRPSKNILFIVSDSYTICIYVKSEWIYSSIYMK
uniref:tRNA(Ile)-lysidine synthase n=1 Tax=Rhodella violacea TaxID=2801 RepID=UPI001FCCDEEF|nr:tRNA(Ile)-lysidine synthase [Rhodella violacea]UNJ18089.1 tRNA(Ile)-lysidine synthase [Rhodella violacea]